MIKAILSLIALMIVINEGHAGLPASMDGEPLPTLAPVLERVTPAVVNIHTQTRVRVNHPLADDPFFRQFFGMPRERVNQSLGSGVIVDADQGYILTNNHVIEGADDIQVTLATGVTLTARLIGSDPDTDVAVIRIPADNLTQLELSDSDQLRVGDFVVAVGNPFGLGQTVTSGIVSALGRQGLRDLNYQNFIQTDASINPGNSGGALINLRGELVGVNTAIVSPSGGNIGIGFAIPTNIARYVMNELIEHGAVRRGTLGVALQEMSAEIAEILGMESASGARVTRVRDDSAARRLGIEAGDVIVELDARPITNPRSLRNAEGLLPVGEEVEVVWLHDGKRHSGRLEVVAALPTEIEGSAIDPRLAGTLIGDLDDNLSLELGIDGVVLLGVQRGSAAWRYGLRRGDVIRAVDRQDIDGITSLKDRFGGADEEVLLNILRGRRSYLVLLD